jgi:2-desacetyl-2-hydroxyethyl bacteriochlorophyllide A dehydrogenase
LRNHFVHFTAPNVAELAEEEIRLDDLVAGEAVVQTEFSVISSGTEGAGFTDLVREMPNLQGIRHDYPRRTGYGNLGTVIAVGPGTREAKVGDRILSFSRHGSHQLVNVGLRGRAFPRPRHSGQAFALQVPREVDGRRAVMTRMAGVAITALRSSTVQAGDRVIVIGLGLVGNMAAQLFQIAGARVLGLDVSAKRLEVARACGILEVFNATSGDPVEYVRNWSGDGQGAEVVVEAIGRSELVMQAVDMTRRFGETILLGSPRARVQADVTPMLTRIHVLAIRMIGALEWTYPIEEDAERARFTIERNYKEILRWIIDGRLVVGPLVSHVLSPRRAQEAYDGLTNRKDEYTAVVFDWSEFHR